MVMITLSSRVSSVFAPVVVVVAFAAGAGGVHTTTTRNDIYQQSAFSNA
jgi:hypothetical protein